MEPPRGRGLPDPRFPTSPPHRGWQTKLRAVWPRGPVRIPSRRGDSSQVLHAQAGADPSLRATRGREHAWTPVFPRARRASKRVLGRAHSLQGAICKGSRRSAQRPRPAVEPPARPGPRRDRDGSGAASRLARPLSAGGGAELHLASRSRRPAGLERAQEGLKFWGAKQVPGKHTMDPKGLSQQWPAKATVFAQLWFSLFR